MKQSQPARRQPSALTLALARRMRVVQGTVASHGKDIRVLKRNDVRQDAKLSKHAKEIRDGRRRHREERRMLITLLSGLTALRREVSLLKQVPEALDAIGKELFRKLDARLPPMPGEVDITARALEGARDHHDATAARESAMGMRSRSGR